MSNRRSPEQWRSTLSAFHRSGKTQSAFCSEHGLSLSSLQYQLRRERSRAEDPASRSPRLLEITPMSDRDDLRPAQSHRALRVECSLDSRTVSIDCEPDQLARLLGELSAFHDQDATRG